MRIVKVLLIHIDKFFFPVEFVIQHIRAYPKITLILERPFMETARMLVDIEKGRV